MQQPEMAPWVGSSYTLAGNSMASREALNCYLQSGEGKAKYSALLIGTPGTVLLTDLSDLVGSEEASCRGLHLTGASPYEGGNLYWVYGSKLGYTYKDELTGNLVNVVLYDIGLDTKRCSFADNGFSVVVTTGQAMYVVDIFTDAVEDVTSSLPFTLPLEVAFLFGRIYAISGDPTPTTGGGLPDAIKSNLIWYSELADAKTWDGLSYVPADLNSDPVTSIEVRQGDLWALGTRSYQIFTTTQDADEPLAYVSGSGTYIGTDAPDTVASIGDNIFWLGSNASGRNMVFMGAGYNSTRISDHGVETALDRYKDLTSSAYGFAYQEAGHQFYNITIPSGNYQFEGSERTTDGITLTYDALTGEWANRASREPKTGNLQAWQPLFSAFAWGKIVVGNLLWSAIMELRNDTYTDYDPTTADKRKPILRRYAGPQMYNNLQSFICHEFQWDLVQGQAPLNGLSSEPTAQLEVSYDGGNTFGSMIPARLQSTGRYAGVLKWIGLGLSRSFVFRVTITEDMQFMAGQARTRHTMSSLP
jgi:hypothetical protein